MSTTEGPVENYHNHISFHIRFSLHSETKIQKSLEQRTLLVTKTEARIDVMNQIDDLRYTIRMDRLIPSILFLEIEIL